MNISEWYRSEDGNALKVLALSALLILILFFLFLPERQPDRVAATIANPPLPVPELPPVVRPRPAVKAKTKKPAVLYLVEEPSAPPLLLQPATPCPTPPGGGILRKIVFSSNRADGRYLQLYMMDSDGRNVERLTDSRGFDRDPHFSYDGRLLAFSSNRETGTYQVYVMDMETRAVRQLTRDSGDKTNPFWSPDGHRILFTLHRDGETELGIMNADGGDSRRLTRTRGDSHGYGFSPDGRRVSFESTWNRRNEIFTYDLSDEKASLLIRTDDISYRGDPVFSPRGDKMVFTSDVLDHRLRQLYIYDLSWDKYYPITRDELDKDDPVFSPDGTLIAYVARWENAWNIFITDADGKNTRNLTCSYYDNFVPTWR